MIISGTLHLDPAEHAAATASLGDRLADLDARRRAAESVVDRLLASWHGDAAAAFRDHWETWRRTASEVVDQLDATVDALTPARAEVVTADDRSGVTGDGLRARLSGRLP